MICCRHCFKDQEIQEIIKGLGVRGNCQTCGRHNEYIYDSEEHTRLEETFEDLLNIYKPVHSLPPEYPKEHLNLLKNELYENWNIFNVERELIYRLLTNICKIKYEENPELFDLPVGITEVCDDSYQENYSILRSFNWKQFVTAIKEENRFHTNHMNTAVFGTFLSYVKKSYTAGEVFYRARICNGKEGFPAEQMGAPPKELATAGRANPEGISHLYLSSDIVTTFNEIRAGAYDYVSVAEFVLKEDISVVDLTSIDKISPFFPQLDCTQHAINKQHLREISNEIAKPLRRHDRSLDYLPTQYIAEFIKSIRSPDGKQEYNGIKFESTRSKTGYNMMLFHESAVACRSVRVHEIKDVQYTPALIDERK